MSLCILAAACVMLSVSLSSAKPSPPSCDPPPGFSDEAPPEIDPEPTLVARVEEIIIDRPLDHVLAIAERSTLEELIDGNSPLPSVVATRVLTPGPFGSPGSRRLVCLSDRSALVEQVLVNRREGRQRDFRYVVWNYTSSRARAIRYGVGHFIHRDLGGGRTHVRWSYAFRLRGNRFPGVLGPLGRWLFRVGFLNGDYARMMQGTLKVMKKKAEAS